ncbi:MAG: metallophosphoesterase [Bacteroidales bacterium]|nr:metallophosphoesterase [Bacteroidales bacterium]
MRKTVFLTVLLLVAAACSSGPRLVIIHTNDTHSHLDPVRGGRSDGKGGIIERAAFVDSVRHAVGKNKVLLLHAGDFNQGSSYYSELGGSLEVEMVNALGYDCIALGNHELDDGLENLTQRVQRINCPVLCANLDFSHLPIGEVVKPWTVIRRGGMKIGIIGLESDISTNVSNEISSRIPQLDNVEVTNKWAEFLRDEQKCDLVILLSHLGYHEDQAIVPQIRGIDLVVGGHSHSFVDGFVYKTDLDGKEVPIITDGCFGIEMGVVKIY